MSIFVPKYKKEIIKPYANISTICCYRIGIDGFMWL